MTEQIASVFTGGHRTVPCLPGGKETGDGSVSPCRRRFTALMPLLFHKQTIPTGTETESGGAGQVSL